MFIKSLKTLVISLFLILIVLPLYSQDKKEKKDVVIWEFDTLSIVKSGTVKSQDRTGTCWDFGTVSFIESELLRLNKGLFNISEMFIVRNVYPVKARKYLLLHGNYTFAQGGQAHDVMNAIRLNGMMPESVYHGMNIGLDIHNHGEMDAVLKAMMKAVVSRRGGEITPRWNEALEGVLDAYLGHIPEEFSFNGKQYTPQSFAKDMEINPDNYVELTSFSYYPFYEKCLLDVPDNWSMDPYYNLPIDDFMEVMYNSLENGYSIVWDGDVSDKYFSHKNGVAYVPEVKWQRYSEESEKEYIARYQKEVAEVTQEDHDKSIYNQTTTDDHLMHLVGITKDQFGNKYFITKNSWSAKSNDFGGYLNISDKYIRLRSIAIMVHKDAIPKNIAKKLGIK